MTNIPISDFSALSSTDVATSDILPIVDLSEALATDQNKKVTLASIFGCESPYTFGAFPITPSSAPTTDYQVANKKYVDDNSGISTISNGRLTLTTATPVMTTGVSGATTLYFTPYNGNNIAIYNGSAWVAHTFTELSISLVGLTASTPYDVFIYNNAGTPTLSLTAWTNTTTRATAIVYQGGIYVKSGATGYRYLGTIYINSTGGQCDMIFNGGGTNATPAVCGVWNYYNRINLKFILRDTTATSYTTSTWRYYNNNGNNKIQFVCGVKEDAIVTYVFFALARNQYIGFDYDAATGADDLYGYIVTSSGATAMNSSFSDTKPFRDIGAHYLALLQYGQASGSVAIVTAGININA